LFVKFVEPSHLKAGPTKVDLPTYCFPGPSHLPIVFQNLDSLLCVAETLSQPLQRDYLILSPIRHHIYRPENNWKYHIFRIITQTSNPLTL